MKSYIKTHRYLFIFIFTVTLTYSLSRYYIQFTLIQGDSMLPTYHNMQLVITDKLRTDFTYGDVIIFTRENLHATLVKRVVALPGDTVEIQNGILFVNNIPSETQLKEYKISNPGIAITPIILSNDEYFVLGDNYEFSKDSRYLEIGCIKKSAILGKIIFPKNS